MRIITTRTTRSRQAMRQFFSILYSLNRRAELKRLVTWAQKKRLSGPQRHYEFLLTDTEVRLARYNLQYRRLTTIAYVFHRMNYLLFPEPTYISQGSARVYRKVRLTSIHQKSYS